MDDLYAHRPAVVLVGRPNVGKSTLFNRLCGTRDALVADYPGLTRDRRYGRAVVGERTVTLIDTGGLTDVDQNRAGGEAADVFRAQAEQVDVALAEAQLALLVADAREGLTAADQHIAERLRRRGVEVIVVVNKADAAPHHAPLEFASLGFECVAVSAVRGQGLAALGRAVTAGLPVQGREPAVAAPGIKVAVVGRPNVGKSTLVNCLLGDERQVVYDQPGTTRDAIDIAFGDYLLIDTAGVRRKGRVTSAVEKFSIVKTLDALERAEVAVLVTDAREGVVDQDLHILSYALDAGAGLVLAVNKWDGMDEASRRVARTSVNRRLAFAPWIPVRFVSALRDLGVQALLEDVAAVHRAGAFDVKTAVLNRILAEAVRDHAPPAVGARPIKLRFAHAGGTHPPVVVVHGNQTEALPVSYRRYLANRFRDELELVGVPVKIETRTSENPFSGRRNELSRRQRKSRERLIRHRQGRHRRGR